MAVLRICRSIESEVLPNARSHGLVVAIATVFGTTVPISVMASDGLDVARVDFFVNNMAIGTDTTPDTGSLYRAVWNSTTVPDSAQTTITAVACDAALNCTTVAAVVNVSNVGLVAAFRFDELTGNSVVDAATHAAGDGANNGTFAAGVTRVGGVSGGALEFDGLSGMVTVPDAGSLDVRQMTLEAWVKPNTSAGWQSVILKQWTENPWAGLAYSLYANSDRDGGPGTYTRPSGWSSDQRAVAPVRLAPGVWHHLAATYDGTRLRLYVNGLRVASPAVSTPLTTSGMSLFIGGNRPFGEFFSGMIDEVRIYNRALSLAEVQAAAVRP